MVVNKVFLVAVGICWSILIYAQEKTVVPKDTSIVRVVDKIPQFPGGLQGWRRFLENNLDISRAAQALDSVAYVKYGSRQTAYLEFTVCEDGEICDIEVRNKDGVSPEFSREVLRIMKKSPKWEPGKVGDRPVRTRFKQPITAVLDL